MTDHNREEREALIEKAARAIKPRFDDYCVDADAEDHAWEAAEAAFAVFEQAHTPTRTVIQITPEAVQREYELRNGVTPTDDEREALATILGEPVRGTLALADRILASGFRRTVQGKPTDADAVLGELAVRLNNEAYGKPDFEWGQIQRQIQGVEMARAALRAAAATQEGENR